MSGGGTGSSDGVTGMAVLVVVALRKNVVAVGAPVASPARRPATRVVKTNNIFRNY